LSLLVDQEPALGTSRHAAVLDRIEPDIPNVRAALRWAIETDEGEIALWLAARLWRYWNAFGLGAEGRQLTVAALALPSAAGVSLVRAWAASALGSLAYWQADPANARIWYQQQIDLATAVG